MARKKSGQVTLRGRFPAGARVRLVKVRDESVLRAEGGRTVGSEVVGEDGSVTFSDGVEVGGRYLAVGHVRGSYLEVRVRGNEAGDESAVTAQAPIGPDRVRLSDGSWLDEAPERQETPSGEASPAPALSQVAEGTLLRSDTPRGYAHPVEEGEKAPYPGQDDVDDDAVQRSDTESGQATPIEHQVPASQDQVRNGTLQRSATEGGYATPIPQGDAVEAQRVREAADTKAAIGDPGKAAANPAHAARTAGDEELKGEDLQARASELDISGRSKMSADELRAAVAEAEDR